MPQKKVLLAIDAINLIRRVYEGNPDPAGFEKAEAAMVSSYQSFCRALGTHKPTHCLWLFDSTEPCWRYSRFPDYKLNRKPMDPELAYEITKFKGKLQGEGWAIDERPGYEADDCLMSLAWQVGQQCDLIILTNDKDSLYTLDYGAHIYDHFKREWVTPFSVYDRYGVTPAQMLDFLALVGDKVDNIPKIQGLGAKTAAGYLAQYETLDGVLAAAARGELSGQVGRKLAETPEIPLLARELVSQAHHLYLRKVDWQAWARPPR